MALVDPHSYTDGAHPMTAHAALAFYLDFAASAIHASALVTLSAPHSGDLLLDTRALAVHSASTAAAAADAPEPIPFSLAAEADPVLGSALTLTLPPDTTSFLLTFSTSPDASALQWLSPPQTTSNLPFVFSQCQSIHARSIFPCHDTPAARITYSLLLNVPARLSAVAAARHVARRDPVSSDHRGACDDALWCAPGRIVEEFEMAQCVPPYLFAFAAGAIGSRDLGPRTRVYAEGGDTLLDDAAREFAGVEDMVKVGESLFGPYEWERFDLLVLPPSFPYGGMENPRMVFLTPTVIKGDAAGAQVVAHELAHSWTGNLITNKTNEDFWLNEGFTTYAERRIVEVVQGEERAALNMGIGWRGLNRMMERFKDNMEFTKLKPKMAGIDPDDVYSEVPYEKGFQFLWRIERQIGRPAFDEFLKKYIATFKFQSIDTETFLEFLKANVPGIENQIDLDVWINGTGIPPDAMEPDSVTYRKICTLAAEFKSGKIPSEDEVADWSGQEWELYLENLSTDVEASQACTTKRTALYQALLTEHRHLSTRHSQLQLEMETNMVPKAQVETLAKRIDKLHKNLNDKKEFEEQHGSCISEATMAQRLAEQEKRHEAVIQAEREMTSRYKKELEDTQERHAVEIRDIRDQVADTRKAQQEEMRKLGIEYTAASKAAAAAEEKLQAHEQKIHSFEQKIKGYEADIQIWLTRLHVLDIQFGKVFPESTIEAHSSVRSVRMRQGQDVEAPWGISDFLTSLKHRVPPMSNFGQDLLKPCVKTLNALWPRIDCRVDASFLSNKLDGVDERLSEWRESAARAAADEALTFVLSWYEDIDLDCLQTLRDGSKWMDDPELVKRRKQRAHAIAQYSTCHHWTPDMCPDDEKVDPFLGESDLEYRDSSDGQYADSDLAGNEEDTPAAGNEEGTSAAPAANAGTDAAGTEAPATGTSDPAAAGTEASGIETSGNVPTGTTAPAP